VNSVKLRIPIVLATALLTLWLPGQALATPPEANLRPVAITAAAGTIAARVSPIPVLATGASQTSGHVRVDNISTLNEDVTIRVADYSVDAAGAPVPAPPDFQFGSASWYRFATPEFALPSGMSLDVPFELVIPVGVGAGDHFAALIVTVQAQPGQVTLAPDNASARSVLVFQSRLQHRIAGARPETPTVALSAQASASSVHFTARVGNGGNTVLGHQSVPTPTLTLYSISPWGDPNRIERTIAVGGFYVAPESVRDVAVEWADTPLVGQYRAVFSLPAADGQPEVTAETTLTIVNVPALAMIGFALLATLMLLGYVVTHRGSRRRRAALGAIAPA
jgi:hypothetical protein